MDIFLVKSEFKWKKALKIYGETLFYTIFMYVVMLIFVNKKFEIEAFVKNVFPILTKVYWFINCYLLMYILSPYINKFIYTLSKEEYKKLLIILIIAFSIMSILPSTYSFDQSNGYSVTWFICLYLIAGYIRLHYTKKVKTGYYLLTYLISATILTIGIVLINSICNYLGISSMAKKILQYNNIIVLIEAVALFMFFKQLNIKNSILTKIILYIAPLTLAVYLIHENRAIIPVLYTQILHAEICHNNPYSIFIAIGSIILVFIICMIIEIIRRKLMKISKKILVKIKIRNV